MNAESFTNGSDLLTTAQVAKMVRRTIATVNRWAQEGRLNVAAQANGRLYYRADVEALIDNLAAQAEERAAALRQAAS